MQYHRWDRLLEAADVLVQVCTTANGRREGGEVWRRDPAFVYARSGRYFSECELQRAEALLCRLGVLSPAGGAAAVGE